MFVTLQLLGGLLVETPEPGEPLSRLETLVLDIHGWLGMGAFLIVLMHWIGSTARPSTGLHHLFPWGASDRAQILSELRGLLRLRLPQGGPSGKLAGFIHGLGLLAATGMGVSGAVLFFWLPEDGRLSPLTGGAEELHELIAPLMWAYWGGHIAMGVLHQLVTRDATLTNMFSLKADEPSAPHAEAAYDSAPARAGKAAKTRLAAASVASISAAPCAADTKPASNAEGAR